MFFISWGSHLAVAPVGDAGVRHCERCGDDTYFSKMVEYRVRHVYWLFRWISERIPYIVCGNCGVADHGDSDDYDSAEVRKAIPFLDRRGWTLGAGGVAAMVVALSVAGAADNAADRDFIAAPHAGDVYKVDLARMVERPEAPRMYSTMRVTGVNAAAVEVQISKNYYKDARGIERDVNRGLAAAASYYMPDKVVIPRASLQGMYAEGIVQDVAR